MSERSQPWFKFYPGDFLSSPRVRLLEPSQRSFLTDMWCYHHRLGGGLPSEVDRIARLVGAPVEDCQLLLQQFFKQDSDGTWFSPRMRREQQESARVSRSRSDAAKARWGKDSDGSDPSGGSPPPRGSKGAADASASANAGACADANACAKGMLSESESEAGPERTSAPGVRTATTAGAIHSESSAAAAGSVALSGPERRTRRYAGTGGPRTAQDILTEDLGIDGRTA